MNEMKTLTGRGEAIRRYKARANAEGAPLRVIRSLNFLGTLLLTGAVGITVHEILRAIHIL